MIHFFVFQPNHKMLVLIAKASSLFLNGYTELCGGTRKLNFGFNVYICPFFSCAISEGSRETARMRSLS